MNFSDLEAQVKDVFVNATPKLVLRQAKRVVRQLNNILDGKLDTKTAITEVLNKEATEATLTISNDTLIADDDTNSWFANETATNDYVYLYSASGDNNGLYAILNYADDDTITVTGDYQLSDESSQAYQIVVFRLATNFTLSYDSTYELFKLGLPDNINKLSFNGLMVNEVTYDERDIEYVVRNLTEECFAIDERGSLALPKTAFVDDVDTLVKGYFGITVPSSSGTAATIDVPAQWEEGFLAGVLAKIAVLENFKDADTYKTQSSIWNNIVAAIIKQEGNRFSTEEHNRNYNYQSPSSE